MRLRDNTLYDLLTGGANRRLVITFPDNSNLDDLTEEVQEGSARFSHIACSEKDLKFGANPAQFSFTAHDIGDITGERILAYWSVEGYQYPVYFFDGIVETAELKPDRTSREIIAYDELKRVQKISVKEWWDERAFVRVPKTDYRGAFDKDEDYNYNDVVTYDDKVYRWLVAPTDRAMYNDMPVLVSEVIKGKEMTEILSSAIFKTYVQELSEYEPFTYHDKTLGDLYYSLCTELGLSYIEHNLINDQMYVQHTKVESMTAGEFFAYYAQLNAAFVVIDPLSGAADVKSLGADTVSYSQNYEALHSSYKEYSVERIDGVKLYAQNGAPIQAYGNNANNPYVLQNPLITEAAENINAYNLYVTLGNVTYTPADISAIVSLPVDIGTKIQILDHQGTLITTYALSNEMFGTQMINQRISAEGQKKRDLPQISLSEDYIAAIDGTQQAAQRANADANSATADVLDEINNRSGLTYTSVPSDLGGRITILHNRPDWRESDRAIEISAESVRFSNEYNGGQNPVWNTELKIDGEMITRILSATGVNAEWIKAGIINAVELHGVTGDIGGWTINDYALMAEIVSAARNKGYRVVLRAPKRALFSDENVFASHADVYFNSETGEMALYPDESGELIYVDIKMPDAMAAEKYEFSIYCDYPDETLVSFKATYITESQTHTIQWPEETKRLDIDDHDFTYALNASQKKIASEAVRGSGLLRIKFPIHYTGEDIPYRLEIRTAAIDDEPITPYITGLPNGIGPETVLGIVSRDRDECLTEIKSDGTIFAKNEEIREEGTLFLPNGAKINLGSRGNYITTTYVSDLLPAALDANINGTKLYQDNIGYGPLGGLTWLNLQGAARIIGLTQISGDFAVERQNGTYSAPAGPDPYAVSVQVLARQANVCHLQCSVSGDIYTNYEYKFMSITTEAFWPDYDVVAPVVIEDSNQKICGTVKVCSDGDVKLWINAEPDDPTEAWISGNADISVTWMVDYQLNEYTPPQQYQTDVNALREVEQVLNLPETGTTSERVARINRTLQVQDTSGTENEQVARARSMLSLSESSTTGSDVLDNFNSRILYNTGEINDIRDKLEMSAGIGTRFVFKTLTPTKQVRKYLYMVRAQREYGPDNAYQYAVYGVKPYTEYQVSGSTPSNTNQHPLVAIYDENWNLLSVYGTDANTVYTDYAVTADPYAAWMVVNSGKANANIRVVGMFYMTGSKVVDNNTLDIETLKAEMAQMHTTLDAMQETVTIGTTITPTSTNSGLYNINDGTIYPGSSYKHNIYDVADMKFVFVSGASATNISSYPLCAAYDENGTLLDSYGIDPVVKYEDYKVQLPAGTARVVVNSSMATAPILMKEGIVDESEAAGGGGSRALEMNLADIRVMDAKKNPFRLSPLDKGYVTFVIDDLLTDLDSIASIFAEYGYPIGIAAIPDRLDVVATALQETRGNYTPGMTMREIMAQVVADGGEIMTHNSAPVVRVDNQDDPDFMHGYFVNSRLNLENAGFKVRGLIRAGGEGAISGTPQIERWLTLGGYEYSNIGSADNYNQDRITIQKPQATIMSLIQRAHDNKEWLKWMVHGYAFGQGETFRNEADLREILDYCQEIGIPVVTYAYIFDHFSSSELLERTR